MVVSAARPRRARADLGCRPEALALLAEGRELACASGERLYECSSIEMGDCHLADGQPRAALAEFQAAREIVCQFGARTLLEATRGWPRRSSPRGTRPARGATRPARPSRSRSGPGSPLAGAALWVVASAAPTRRARPIWAGRSEMFDRAVEVLTGAGAELELARTLDAYAEFEDRSGRDETAAELRRQASQIAAQMRRARGGVTGGTAQPG